MAKVTRHCPYYVSAERVESAKRRAIERERNTDNRARVTHPQYGEVIVPCASKLAAIDLAAIAWHCKTRDIVRDAEVWFYDG